MGFNDKKISQFTISNNIPLGSRFPFIDLSAPIGQQNKTIEEADFKTALGITNNTWINAGTFTYSQIISGTNIDSGTREINLITAPQFHAITSLMVRNNQNIVGGGVAYCAMTLINSANEIVADNILDDFTTGALVKKFKLTTNIVHIDNSDTLENTGIVYKIRVAIDTNIASITGGSFSVFYKTERIIP